ncbi:MAG: hypothetical protein HQL30_07185 [Candidatus Omnitrophica bacterium]|nr:hypothetical protein [Candidatus Omnitrophota bacterium]
MRGLYGANRDQEKIYSAELWRFLFSLKQNRAPLVAEIRRLAPRIDEKVTIFFSDGYQYVVDDISAVHFGMAANWKPNSLCFRIRAVSSGRKERHLYLKRGNIEVEDVARRVYGALDIPTPRGLFVKGENEAGDYELIEEIPGETFDQASLSEKIRNRDSFGYQLGKKLFVDLACLIGDGIPRNNILGPDGRIYRIDTEVAFQEMLLVGEINPLSEEYKKIITDMVGDHFPTQEKLGYYVDITRPYFANFAANIESMVSGDNVEAMSRFLQDSVKKGFIDGFREMRLYRDEIIAILRDAQARDVRTNPHRQAIQDDVIKQLEYWSSLNPFSMDDVYDLFVVPAIITNRIYFDFFASTGIRGIKNDSGSIVSMMRNQAGKYIAVNKNLRKNWAIDIDGFIEEIYPLIPGKIDKYQLGRFVKTLKEEEFDRYTDEIFRYYETTRLSAASLGNKEIERMVLLKIIADKTDEMAGVDTSRVLMGDSFFYNNGMGIVTPLDMGGEFEGTSLFTDSKVGRYRRFILTMVWRIKYAPVAAEKIREEISRITPELEKNIGLVAGHGPWKLKKVASVGGGSMAWWKRRGSFVFSVIAENGHSEREFFVKIGDFRMQELALDLYRVMGMPFYGARNFNEKGIKYEIAEKVHGKEGYKIPGEELVNMRSRFFESMGAHAFYNLAFRIGDTYRRNDIIRENGEIVRIDQEVSFRDSFVMNEKRLLTLSHFKDFCDETAERSGRLGLSNEDMSRIWLLAAWMNIYFSGIKGHLESGDLASLSEYAGKGFIEASKKLTREQEPVELRIRKAIREGVITNPTGEVIDGDLLRHLSKWAGFKEDAMVEIAGILKQAVIAINKAAFTEETIEAEITSTSKRKSVLPHKGKEEESDAADLEASVSESEVARVSGYVNIFNRVNGVTEDKPYNIYVDVDAIPPDSLEPNLVMCANMLIAEVKNGMDVRYILYSGDGTKEEKANALFAAVVGKLSLGSKTDPARILSSFGRGPDPDRESMTADIYVTDIKGARQDPSRFDGAALVLLDKAGYKQGDGVLYPMMSAINIGLLQSTLLEAGLNDPARLEGFQKAVEEIFPLMKEMYERHLPALIITKETVAYMADPDLTLRINLFSQLTLPPAIKLSIKKLTEFAYNTALLMQFA